ncbi:MAG: cyclase family protein [Capsulimonadales bacterium]|nr:cyclase family protein [Capsulimonadales bacterium]
MRLIDLSTPLYDGVPNCPGHPPVRIENVADHPGERWRLEMLTIPSHTGSHVDAPFHKLSHGPDLDRIPLESWVGPAFIADFRRLLSDGEGIRSEHLADCLPWETDSEHDPVKGCIILLATGAGERKATEPDRYLHRSPFLCPEGAAYLVGRGVRGVGIDHYSVGGTQQHYNEETHEILLGAGIWVVEDLHFPPEAFEAPQPCEFWSLPIRLQGGSGMFCRPVLVVDR